ncbi:MAG TPA: hypothetical protein VFF52_23230 [Isosphaeraceae bacterium]|nr:hypothetical protein [Isosphaeraceae bacterium]
MHPKSVPAKGKVGPAQPAGSGRNAAAQVLGIAQATAEADWTYSKAWLRRQWLRGEPNKHLRQRQGLFPKSPAGGGRRPSPLLPGAGGLRLGVGSASVPARDRRGLVTAG